MEIRRISERPGLLDSLQVLSRRMTNLLFSVLLGLCGVASFWAAISFLRAGEAKVMGGPFRRSAQPVRYWAYTIWLMLLGFLLLLLAALPGAR